MRAILLAPTFFFLYMVWSRPPYLRPTLVLTLAVYVFAHFIFWPPALSAEFVGRKRQLSMAKVVVLNLVLLILCSHLHCCNGDSETRSCLFVAQWGPRHY